MPVKFPEVELVFPKEKQPEQFRTSEQIQAILARGGIDKRRECELWDGLFLDPKQVAEVLENVRLKPNTKYLHPFLTTAAYTGARRGELPALGSRTLTSRPISTSYGSRYGSPGDPGQRSGAELGLPLEEKSDDLHATPDARVGVLIALHSARALVFVAECEIGSSSQPWVRIEVQ